MKSCSKSTFKAALKAEGAVRGSRPALLGSRWPPDLTLYEYLPTVCTHHANTLLTAAMSYSVPKHTASSLLRRCKRKVIPGQGCE